MDHEVVSIHELPISCGTVGVSRISEDIEKVVYALASKLYHPSRGNPCAFFLWSNIKPNAPERNRLEEFIEKNLLGEVLVSSSAENPRTSNEIVVYVWKIDHLVFKNWYKEQRVKRLVKIGN